MDSKLYKTEKEINVNKIKMYGMDKSGVVDFYPRYIQIEQTNKCNAQCIMCNHFYIKNNGASEIKSVVIEKLEKILPHCEIVMLNGDGEPFLCKSIVDNIKTFAKYGVKIGTNTNLTYIPEECWTILEDSFAFLNISCDGASKMTYEMIRRGLRYEDFITNLEKLNKNAPNLRKNLDCVIMKQNIKELPDIVNFAFKYGFNSVRFHRLGVNPCIRNFEDAEIFYHDILLQKLVEVQERALQLGMNVEIPNFNFVSGVVQREINNNDFQEEIDERQKIAVLRYGNLRLDNDYIAEQTTLSELIEENACDMTSCQWALERCYIDLNGNVTTCCYNMKKNMGNLQTQSFDEIWNGELYIALRKLMLKGMLPMWCKQCNWIKDGKF